MANVIAALLSVVLFFGGAGVTSFASQEALPGDTLYGVKTGLQGARLGLSLTAAGHFDLHMQYAAERVDEIQRLADLGRYRDIEAAVDLLENDLEQAADALSIIAESDPSLAAELAVRYESLVKESADAIAALMGSAPEDLQEKLENALDVLDDALGDVEDDLGGPDDDDQFDDLDDDDLEGPDDDDDSDGSDDDDLAEPDDDDDSDELDDDDLDEPDDDDDSDELDDDDLDEPDDDDDSDELDDDDLEEPEDDDDSDDLDDDDLEEPDDDDD